MKFPLKTFSFILLTCIMVAWSYRGNAQLTEPFQQQSSEKQLADDNPVDPCTDPFIPCPIDDGLTFLLAAGIGYGIIRYKQSKKYPSLKGGECR